MPVIAQEVKKEILEKVKAGEKVAELGSQYGVSDRTIYGWLKRGMTSSVSAIEYGRVKKENQALKEIIGLLTLEVEKLKKKTGSKR